MIGEGCLIGPNVVVGPGCVIEDGALRSRPCSFETRVTHLFLCRCASQSHHATSRRYCARELLDPVEYYRLGVDHWPLGTNHFMNANDDGCRSNL